ncbi:type III-A CRISPR-associated protein Csm2 [Fusobacterium animalis]|jgi:CRISPR-associated protein, csm2 family|uniref:type III-A CRISPR-associated protein Csm2 n=1 Tax=Fusobacterium TaxID=848 RepID=UPI0003B91A78|nr:MULTISPECIES: type III-A CRISPR-associated protein Csm2 [Fusobacterium]ERT30524.1 CRISPR type III-a/mtube-associated protein csm2 [Fusobacterium nucleatum CTI-5]EUB38417.1 CRISPR type III-A/MTUBE-associated protein Csm2 [Fusobacterium sp. CM1]
MNNIDDIDVEKIIKDYKEQKEKIKKKLISTTQLRLLLSNAVVVKNKIQAKRFKEDDVNEEIKRDIKYLLVKHIYQCGRDKQVKEFDKIFSISNNLKEIGNSAKKFNRFYQYLEEIVAYMKYYGFDK